MGLRKAVKMLHKTEAMEKLQSTGMGSVELVGVLLLPP